MTIVLEIDPFPPDSEMNTLWIAAWGSPPSIEFSRILPRSLTHICAYHDVNLIGFVNVAWDGGIHAFILDTCVVPAFRGQGVATRLVRQATTTARERGAHWLHVDFEPRLAQLYSACGFRPSAAGLIDLRDRP